MHHRDAEFAETGIFFDHNSCPRRLSGEYSESFVRFLVNCYLLIPSPTRLFVVKPSSQKHQTQFLKQSLPPPHYTANPRTAEDRRTPPQPPLPPPPPRKTQPPDQ